jgi:hypothetical protein
LALPVQTFEHNDAIDLGKESEILAQPYIRPGVNARPVLANQDGTGMNHLPPKSFHSESLTGAVPAISGASLSFFMSHIYLP